MTPSDAESEVRVRDEGESLSWAEAAGIAKEEFEAIEQRRRDLAEREAAVTPSCCAEDELATELAEERTLHQQALAEVERLRAEVARARVAVAAEVGDV